MRESNLSCIVNLPARKERLSHIVESFGLRKELIFKGRIITNALPGCSWHQWGEAVDCYWLKGGNPNWDLDTQDENNQNGYQVYAYEAKKLGLEAGLYWKNLIDAVHVQLKPFSSPLDIYSISEIDEVMSDLYG